MSRRLTICQGLAHHLSTRHRNQTPVSPRKPQTNLVVAQSGKCNYVRPRTFREAAIKKSLGESITYQYTNYTVALFVLLLFFSFVTYHEEVFVFRFFTNQSATYDGKLLAACTSVITHMTRRLRIGHLTFHCRNQNLRLHLISGLHP